MCAESHKPTEIRLGGIGGPFASVQSYSTFETSSPRLCANRNRCFLGGGEAASTFQKGKRGVTNPLELVDAWLCSSFIHGLPKSRGFTMRLASASRLCNQCTTTIPERSVGIRINLTFYCHEYPHLPSCDETNAMDGRSKM